jgi:glycolate oxidase FAD binding subunit
VMKNVAGYDVSRVIAGSLGTLGLILEVSLKVLPKLEDESTLQFSMPHSNALEKLNLWAGQPLPIVASAWQDGVLTLRLAGARAAVKAAEKKLGGEKVGVGGTALANFWDDLRDQRLPFFIYTAPLWRLSLPSVAPRLDLPGETLIEWGGAQRWLRSTAAVADIRAAAAMVGGSATAFHCDTALKATAGGAFAPLPAPLMNLHRRMKAAFDPQGIFNPGRLYKEF